MEPYILVVEDEEPIRRFICINLTRAGFTVIESETAEKGLERLAHSPDVAAIILDVMLPGMDGFSFCQALREAGYNPAIIMLTARGGSITIETHDIGETVCISVHDTGIGMAPDDLLHVTEKFYKGEEAGVKGGNGLGLAICEELVRLHGGRLEIESALHGGTTVTIYLPQKKDE